MKLMADREVALPALKDNVVTISHGWLRDPDSPSGVYDSDWTLEVTFERPSPEPGVIIDVKLTRAEGVAAAMLRGFGWAQWLRVAEAAIRNPGPPPPMTAGEGDILDQIENWNALHAEAQARVRAAIRRALKAKPHPGRGRRTDAFYENVALLYNAHLRAGQANPTARIAKELDVSRNTVSGWLRRAREQTDLLPESRRGKPG